MRKREGYIALMSAIIISVILMGLLTTLSLGGFFGRFNVLKSEFKNRSFALAQGCAEAAFLNLTENPGYTGSSTLAVASDTCIIFNIPLGSGVIKTQGIFQHAYTNLKLTVATNTMTIVSFEEVPVLP